jgi:hypothetical protein
MAKRIKSFAVEPEETLITFTEPVLPTDTKEKALVKLSPLQVMLNDLKQEAAVIQITDKASLERAIDLVARIKKFETGADKARVKLFEPVRALLSEAKDHVDGLIAEAAQSRISVESKVNAESIRIQKEAEAEHLRRVNLLESAGWVLAGQFYVSGFNRIMFDLIDDADEAQLNLWVSQGHQEQQRVAADREAELQKQRELEERERRLVAHEAELAEFRAWKAAQTAAKQDDSEPLPPAPPQEYDFNMDGRVVEIHTPVFVPSNLPEPEQQIIPAGTIQPVQVPYQGIPATIPAGTLQPVTAPAQQTDQRPEPPAHHESQKTPEINTIDQLAQFRRASITWLESTLEFKVFFNMGIDAVCKRFETDQTRYDKPGWLGIFRSMKR